MFFLFYSAVASSVRGIISWSRRLFKWRRFPASTLEAGTGNTSIPSNFNWPGTCARGSEGAETGCGAAVEVMVEKVSRIN